MGMGNEPLAIVLVLVSAACHASWNLLTKRSADPLAFLVSIGATGGIVYAPVVVWLLLRDGIPTAALPYLAVSAPLEALYALCLAAAYRNGALSLTYPVARGTGVLLVPLLAVPLLDERISPIDGLGILTILGGIVTISVLAQRSVVAHELVRGRRGVRFALLTGLCITSYSLVDKVGVQHANPLVYVYGAIVGSTLLILPYVLLRRRAALLDVLRTRRRDVLIAGVLHVGTYLVVLAAMRIEGANVSTIVPLRETSIVFATILGALVLREPVGRLRVLGSVIIASGVILIALG